MNGEFEMDGIMRNLNDCVEEYVDEIQKHINSCIKHKNGLVLNPCEKQNFPQFVKILKEKCPNVDLVYGVDDMAYDIMYIPNGNDTRWVVGHIFTDGCLSLDDGIHFHPMCIDDYARFAKAVKITIDEEEKRVAMYEKMIRMEKRRKEKLKIVLDGLNGK